MIGTITYQESKEVKSHDDKALAKAKKREQETAKDYEWIPQLDRSLRRVKKHG